MKLDIYTDGAYSNKRKQGGWSYIILYNNKIIHKDFRGVKNTTNNRMEILAVLEDLITLLLLFILIQCMLLVHLLWDGLKIKTLIFGLFLII